MFEFFLGRRQTKREDGLQGYADFANEIRQKLKAHTWNKKQYYSWNITFHQNEILLFLIENIENEVVTKRNYEAVIYSAKCKYQDWGIELPDPTGQLTADLNFFNKIIENIEQYFKNLHPAECKELLILESSYQPLSKVSYFGQPQLNEMQEIDYKTSNLTIG